MKNAVKKASDRFSGILININKKVYYYPFNAMTISKIGHLMQLAEKGNPYRVLINATSKTFDKNEYEITTFKR